MLKGIPTFLSVPRFKKLKKLSFYGSEEYVEFFLFCFHHNKEIKQQLETLDFSDTFSDPELPPRQVGTILSVLDNEKNIELQTHAHDLIFSGRLQFHKLVLKALSRVCHF